MMCERRSGVYTVLSVVCCVLKLLLVGELLSLSIDASMHSDVAVDEFNLCPAATKSQRYLDSLYRCQAGNISLITARTFIHLGFTITMVKTIVFVSILFSFFANEVYRTNM